MSLPGDFVGDAGHVANGVADVFQTGGRGNFAKLSLGHITNLKLDYGQFLMFWLHARTIMNATDGHHRMSGTPVSSHSPRHRNLNSAMTNTTSQVAAPRKLNATRRLSRTKGPTKAIRAIPSDVASSGRIESCDSIVLTSR